VICPGPFRTNLIQTSNALRVKTLGEPFASPPPPEEAPSSDNRAAQTAAWRVPDDIGDQVIRAIKGEEFFVISHAEFKNGWDAYASYVSQSFPRTPVDEDFVAAFPHLIVHPIVGLD
jgi:hypothetical protein